MMKASLSSVRREEAWVYNSQNGEQIVEETGKKSENKTTFMPSVC